MQRCSTPAILKSTESRGLSTLQHSIRITEYRVQRATQHCNSQAVVQGAEYRGLQSTAALQSYYRLQSLEGYAALQHSSRITEYRCKRTTHHCIAALQPYYRVKCPEGYTALQHSNHIRQYKVQRAMQHCSTQAVLYSTESRGQLSTAALQLYYRVQSQEGNAALHHSSCIIQYLVQRAMQHCSTPAVLYSNESSGLCSTAALQLYQRVQSQEGYAELEHSSCIQRVQSPKGYASVKPEYTLQSAKGYAALQYSSRSTEYRVQRAMQHCSTPVIKRIAEFRGLCNTAALQPYYIIQRQKGYPPLQHSSRIRYAAY